MLFYTEPHITLPPCVLLHSMLAFQIQRRDKIRLIKSQLFLTSIPLSRQSIKLHYELEYLVFTVESLGRRYVLFGPTPTMTKSSERFNRLFSLHLWTQNFSTATGLGFISHFDSFWTEWDLFKYDGLHLSRKGTGKLMCNFINFIAFSFN